MSASGDGVVRRRRYAGAKIEPGGWPAKGAKGTRNSEVAHGRHGRKRREPKEILSGNQGIRSGGGPRKARDTRRKSGGGGERIFWPQKGARTAGGRGWTLPRAYRRDGGGDEAGETPVLFTAKNFGVLMDSGKRGRIFLATKNTKGSGCVRTPRRARRRDGGVAGAGETFVPSRG